MIYSVKDIYILYLLKETPIEFIYFLLFDTDTVFNEFTNKFQSNDLKESIENSVKTGHPTYNCIVTIDLQLH